MSYTYSTWVPALANFLVVPNYTTDMNFQGALSVFIDDAEQRLYRELQLLNTVVRDSSQAFGLNTPTFNLPSQNGTFVVVQSISAVSPAGTTSPDNGTRYYLTPSTKETINYLYPNATGSSIPQFFGMVTQNQIVVGPWPDQAYQVEVTGTIRPTPLSSANQTTLLTTYFPDLWFAATMVAGAAYLKNFGAAADDPRMSVTWETHVQTLLTSAVKEEAMKKFTSQAWTSREPAQLATPPRA